MAKRVGKGDLDAVSGMSGTGGTLGVVAGAFDDMTLALKARAAERDAADLAQRESGERYREVVEGTDSLITKVDAEGRFLYVNPVARKVFGLEPEACVGRLAFDFVHPDDREFTLRAFQGWISERLSHTAFENRQVSQAGDILLMSWTIHLHYDEDGSVSVIDGIAQDVTEIRRAELALNESELRYRTLANSGQALIWTSTPDKLCDYFNGPWLAFTGRSLEQELGNGWAEGVHPDDFARCLEIYVTAFDARQGFSMEYRLHHHSGEYRWIVDQALPRHDSKGKFLGYIGHCLDIDDQKRAEEALSVERSILRDILESTLAGYWDWNLRDNTEYLSPMFKRMFGYEDHELENSPETWQKLIHPDDLPGVFEVFRHHVESQGQVPYYSEVRYRHKDGSWVWVICGGRVVEWAEDGQPTRMVGCHVDITERKLAEEALVQAKATAEDSNRAKSEFLANMSHEIRTPLNGVLGMLQLLDSNCSKENQKQFVELAHQAGRRLLNLLNDILDFSRIEAGKLTFRHESFSLRDSLEEVLGSLRLAAEQKHLALELNIDTELPGKFIGDEARLRQLIFNLVGNAIKFTASGSVVVEAWPHPSWQATNNTRVYICVSDTGVGIPDDMQSLVFERFTQTDASYTRQYEGAGLGLAIVKRIVKLMGGDIVVDSEVGVGTSIYLNLRLETPADEAKAPLFTGFDPSMEALHILLAEDDAISGFALQRILERNGHSVTYVKDGLEVIRSLSTGDFDCILMDVQMPEMDGVAATKAIRGMRQLGSRARIPIIAMTAYAMTGDREKFIEAGMDDYVPKPVELEELKKALGRVMEKMGKKDVQ